MIFLAATSLGVEFYACGRVKSLLPLHFHSQCFGFRYSVDAKTQLSPTDSLTYMLGGQHATKDLLLHISGALVWKNSSLKWGRNRIVESIYNSQITQIQKCIQMTGKCLGTYLTIKWAPTGAGFFGFLCFYDFFFFFLFCLQYQNNSSAQNKGARQ